MNQEITGKALRLTPLGGLYESGKNMWVYESCDPKKDSEFLIVDAGILYPGRDEPGVDYTLADFNSILKKQDQIQALVLTSPREAHCGGAHHIITKANIKKVVGSKSAIELVKLRLSEEQINKIEWISFSSREQIKLGSLTVIPFRITSCSAESYSIVVEAQDTKVLYTGNYKLDQTPSDQIKSDIVGITSYANAALESGQQIDLYIGDSTNVEIEGYSKSELEIIPKLRSQIKSAKSRVLINTYNSNTLRIQNIFNIAEELGKKVALLNKDARQVCNAAQEAGVLSFNEKNLVQIQDIKNHKDEDLLILMTAPEGDALAELERIAYDRSLEIQVKEGDTILNSADLPPGTVRIMAQISDQFFLKNIKIIGGASAGIHVEAHACTEEMKFMFNLIRPKYFIPGMGETRQLVRHAKIAVESGFDPGSIFIIENGDQLEITNESTKIIGQIETGTILFNDSQDFQVDKKIVKERDALANEGVVTVSFSINKKNKVVAGPVFSAKACTFSNNKEWRAFCLMNSQDLIDEIELLGTENPNAGIDDFQTLAREHMNRIIKTQIGKKPAVIVLANEV